MRETLIGRTLPAMLQTLIGYGATVGVTSNGGWLHAYCSENAMQYAITASISTSQCKGICQIQLR